MNMERPRTNFRWALEVEGANQMLFQEVKVPTVEFQEILHGTVKTPGKMIVGDLILKKLKPASKADRWIWDWFSAVSKGVASDYKKNGFLVEYDPTGTIAVEKYFLGNIWPKKIEESARKSTFADTSKERKVQKRFLGKLLFEKIEKINEQGPSSNLIQTITFSCETFFPQESPLIFDNSI